MLAAHCTVHNREWRKTMRKKLVTMALLASGLALAGCNTIEGIGKDVKSAGDTVAKTADDAK